VTLYFSNPGRADVRALTTMGVNVKEAGAIGYFGTGFKIATSVVLRLGGSVDVWIGTLKYQFYTVRNTIRGKDFDIVHLRLPDGTSQELGFTTELGKNWEVWMAYREYRSNQMDEGGGVPTTRQVVEQTADVTTVVVSLPAMDEVHQESWKYFLSGEPLQSVDELDVHEHRFPDDKESLIFYRGVRVGKFGRPTLYTYNFTETIRLTEDRTILYPHEMERTWMRAITWLTDEEMIRKILTAPKEYAENTLNFGDRSTASEAFLNVAERLLTEQPRDVNPTLRLLLTRTRGLDPYVWVDPNVLQAKMLMKAEAFVQSMGYDTQKYSIRIVANLRHGVLGTCYKTDIYLSTRVFDMGTKMVAGTLLEEVMHLVHGVEDETRDFQNLLIDKIVGMYEIQNGEPI
jgi:hypothetical protein